MFWEKKKIRLNKLWVIFIIKLLKFFNPLHKSNPEIKNSDTDIGSDHTDHMQIIFNSMKYILWNIFYKTFYELFSQFYTVISF